MTIESTIVQAAAKFGVSVEDITRGGFRKNRTLTAAREWIVASLPEISNRKLAKELGYSDHSSVLYMRRRIALKNSHIAV